MLALDGVRLWQILRWSYSRQKVELEQRRHTMALETILPVHSLRFNLATLLATPRMAQILNSWRQDLSTATSQTPTLYNSTCSFLWFLLGVQLTQIWLIMMLTTSSSISYSHLQAPANSSKQLTRKQNLYTKSMAYSWRRLGSSLASLRFTPPATGSTTGAGTRLSIASLDSSLWQSWPQQVFWL